MAHTKAGGVTKGNRNSIAKRLGVKKYGGEVVKVGNIIVRQKGSNIRAGHGVKQGRDFTLYAIAAGKVQFKQMQGNTYAHVS